MSEKSGVELIADERRRQVEVKGWTATHDDVHEGCELARAAVCYAAPVRVYEFGEPDDIYGMAGSCNDRIHTYIQLRDPWPWDEGDGCNDKRERYDDDRGAGIVDNVTLSLQRRIRMLVIAGALIAAEIDRLQRTARREAEAGA
jgi:hypothetical protein